MVTSIARFTGSHNLPRRATQSSVRKASLRPGLYAIASFAGWSSGSIKIEYASTAKECFGQKTRMVVRNTKDTEEKDASQTKTLQKKVRRVVVVQAEVKAREDGSLSLKFWKMLRPGCALPFASGPLP